MSDAVFYEDVIGAGCHWSLHMGRGQLLRLIDEEGGANVGMLLYNAHAPLERINVPDTLKAQHTFRLTRGHCIYSDMGRVLCSIVEDSAGWHDAVCGTCDAHLVAARWGGKSYQVARNAMHRNGRDGFLIELAKHGMDRRDIVANLNLFSRVLGDEDGNLIRLPNTGAGTHIELRFEMDTLVVLHTCPHPLDLSPEWPARPVRYQIREAPPLQPGDPCFEHCEENRRGLRNNQLYHHARCGGSL
jgi:uncharacterized protein